MNNYIINLWTKSFQKKIDLLNEAKNTFEKIKISKIDKLVWIAFWNQFCEKLNIDISNYIEQINKLQKNGINIYYLTSIITSQNKEIINKNIEKLIKIENINYIINDLSLINKLKKQNIILWQTFYRTRVLIRKNLTDNIIIPENIRKYINLNQIKQNQKYTYQNTFNNKYYRNFIKENDIKWILIDIINENTNNIKELWIKTIISTPFTYVMSWRACITHKITNNLNNTNITTTCNKECYKKEKIKTNYSENVLWEDLILRWNTIFKKQKNLTLENSLILYDNIL